MTDPSVSLNVHPLPLAAGVVGAGLLVVGVVVVILLIGAVWWGIRRRAAEPPPGVPSRRAERRGHRVEEYREPDPAAFPENGERLSPHEMKGYGNLGSRRREDRGDPNGTGRR